MQVVHVIGDQSAGFGQSCVLVYADGRYHRETMQQKTDNGRPSTEWELPHVFESELQPDEMQRLKEIVESGQLSRSGGRFWESRDTAFKSAFRAYRNTPAYRSGDL